VRAIKETRNKLVHEGRFPERCEPWAEFQRVLSVLDRLILGMLGYTGRFVDCRTFRHMKMEADQNPKRP